MFLKLHSAMWTWGLNHKKVSNKMKKKFKSLKNVTLSFLPFILPFYGHQLSFLSFSFHCMMLYLLCVSVCVFVYFKEWESTWKGSMIECVLVLARVCVCVCVCERERGLSGRNTTMQCWLVAFHTIKQGTIFFIWTNIQSRSGPNYLPIREERIGRTC